QVQTPLVPAKSPRWCIRTGGRAQARNEIPPRDGERDRIASNGSARGSPHTSGQDSPPCRIAAVDSHSTALARASPRGTPALPLNGIRGLLFARVGQLPSRSYELPGEGSAEARSRLRPSARG